MRNKQKQQQLQMSTNFADSLPCGVWYLVFSTLVTVCSVRPNTFDIATVRAKKKNILFNPTVHFLFQV